MKHIKLFEDVDSSNWENLFRTIAKFAKPITMDQFIYWNEDLVLDSEAWIEITSFLTKNDALSQAQHDTENLAELIDLGVVDWSDLAKIYNINIMILDGESFPYSAWTDQELMNFYHKLHNIDHGNREIYYSDDNVTIEGGIINNVPICALSMYGGYSVVFFSSNFEKYLK